VRTKVEFQEEDALMKLIGGSPLFDIEYHHYSTSLQQPGTKSDFLKIVKEKWFEMYTWGKRKDISAFEHTFVGEENESGAPGFHFWFKYLLDDSGMNSSGKDVISFGTLYGNGANPDCVAVRFTVDFDERRSRQNSNLVPPFLLGHRLLL
jgi:hypothetical protein